MKTIQRFLILVLFTLPLCSIAQEGGMVDWKFSAKKVNVDTFEIIAKAMIAEGWRIYAQDSGEGSMPTKFTFTTNPLIKLDGKVVEQGELVNKRNEVMDSELKYYGDSVRFVQRVKILRGALDDKKGARGVILEGTVEFMACDEQMCLPPEEIKFKVELK